MTFSTFVTPTRDSDTWIAGDDAWTSGNRETGLRSMDSGGYRADGDHPPGSRDEPQGADQGVRGRELQTRRADFADMSSFNTTYDDQALGGEAVERDARALLGQVMGLVAVAVAFAALGAYLGRDLSGATGLIVFIGAFACIFALNAAASRGREQLAIGLLFGLGLLLGLAVAPVIADYAKATPSPGS